MMSYSYFLYAVLLPLISHPSSTPHKAQVEVETLSPEQREIYARIEASIEKIFPEETLPPKLNPNAKSFSPVEALTPSEYEEITPTQKELFERIHSNLENLLQEEDIPTEELIFEQDSGFIAIHDSLTDELSEMESGRSSYSPRTTSGSLELITPRELCPESPGLEETTSSGISPTSDRHRERKKAKKCAMTCTLINTSQYKKVMDQLPSLAHTNLSSRHKRALWDKWEADQRIPLIYIGKKEFSTYLERTKSL